MLRASFHRAKLLKSSFREHKFWGKNMQNTDHLKVETKPCSVPLKRHQTQQKPSQVSPHKVRNTAVKMCSCKGDRQNFCLIYWLPPQHGIHQCLKIHPLPGPGQNNPAAQVALGSGQLQLFCTGYKQQGGKTRGARWAVFHYICVWKHRH